MDPALKKCDYCGFMPNTVAHQERSEPLERRIAELEAEVERLKEELLLAHGISPEEAPR